jgi:hypothetical protein
VFVLRINHAAGADVLSGVWEVTCSSRTIGDFWFVRFEKRPLWAKEINMLWTIFVVLLILWLLGFSLHIAGGLIHLLLVVALVVLVINLVSGRRAVV